MNTTYGTGTVNTRAGMAILMVIGALGLAACDKAKADYEKCVKLEAQGDLEGAAEACETAVQIDPDSTSGNSAAKKVSEFEEARAKKKAAAAKKAAAEAAERKRLLGSLKPSWEPRSKSQVTGWTTLVERYPESAEAKQASWRLTQQSSVCARYAGRIPFNFTDYPIFEEDLVRAVAVKISQWEPSKGLIDILSTAKGAQLLLSPKQESLVSICNEIEGHTTSTSEESVRRSLLSDCRKLKRRQARMQETLDTSAGAGLLMDRLSQRWPKFHQSLAGLTKDLITSADERQLMCKKMGAPPWESSDTRKSASGAPSVADESDPSNLVTPLLEGWLAAQNDRDFEKYGSYYAPAFTGIKKVGARQTEYDRAAWLKDRRSMFKKPMKVTATDRKIETADDRATMHFTQHWSSGSFADRGTKKIVIIDGKIVSEEMLTSEVVSR